jgi:hypothetical protein
MNERLLFDPQATATAFIPTFLRNACGYGLNEPPTTA